MSGDSLTFYTASGRWHRTTMGSASGTNPCAIQSNHPTWDGRDGWRQKWIFRPTPVRSHLDCGFNKYRLVVVTHWLARGMNPRAGPAAPSGGASALALLHGSGHLPFRHLRQRWGPRPFFRRVLGLFSAVPGPPFNWDAESILTWISWPKAGRSQWKPEAGWSDFPLYMSTFARRER